MEEKWRRGPALGCAGGCRGEEGEEEEEEEKEGEGAVEGWMRSSWMTGDVCVGPSLTTPIRKL